MDEYQVGGQGLLDGVMMNGKIGVATAKRKLDRTIDLRLKKHKSYVMDKGLKSFPFFRGFFVIFRTVKNGMSGFNNSSKFMNEILDEKQIQFLCKILNKNKKSLSNILLIFFMGIFLGMFFLLIPIIISGTIGYFFNLSYKFIYLLEIGIVSSIIILYLFILGNNKDIKAMFKYHGAEHKTIACYEKGLELNINNVKKQSKYHKRCGSNILFYIFITLYILGIGFMNFDAGLKILFRFISIPISISFSYEIVNFTVKKEWLIATGIGKIGMLLQILTTKEPSDENIEVAILALKKAEGLRVEKTIRELLNDANQRFKKAEIESYILDAQLLMCHVLEENKLWVMTNVFDRIGQEKEDEFLALVEKREQKYPMNYILGNAEFMGMDFFIKEGVLIPRPDTEILVEEVLKRIAKYDKLDVCDLCCGSGAIGLTIAQYRINTKVDLLDIDKIPKEVTSINIKNFEVSDRAKFIHSDLLENASKNGYDIIVSNPPYIREDVIGTLMDDVKNYEPHLALSGGEDGLIFYREITKQSVPLLKGKKILAYEIGHDQGEDVKKIMSNSGFINIEIIKDLAGHDRVVIGNLL